ncbi:putative lipase 1 protein [Seiridium cardinale]
MALFSIFMIAAGSPLAMTTAVPAVSTLEVRQQSSNASGYLIPPSQDPWYAAPLGYELSQLGAVLRLRSAPGNQTTAVGNCSAAYQILYRTSDSRFEPSVAVTTLYIPEYASAAANELLSFQYPYNSPSLDHSPSYSFQFSAAPEVGTALGKGWYVNVPDHEGILAADGANLGQGLATLDSVRAVLSTGCGLQNDTKYAMMGYSGGALASEWAAELQAQYAPELQFSGTAIGGTPPNVTSVWDSVNGTPYSGMIPLSFVGVTRPYSGMFEWLVSQLKTEGQYNGTTFLKVQSMSAPEAFVFFATQDIWEYFVDGRAVLDEPTTRRILDDNFYMGYHGFPHMPLYMHHAIHDEFAIIAHTDEYVERLCGIHVGILYERNTIGDHISQQTNGVPAAFDWLDGIFAGTQAEGSCTIRNVTVDLSQ